MEQLQFGVDIATSLAIIGAFFSWSIDNHRQRRLAREIGINDQARAIAANKVQDTTWDLSKRFIALVEHATKIETRIDRPYARDGRDGVARRIEADDAYLQDINFHLHALKEELSLFYEACHTHKYVLFPVLKSLPEGESLVASVSKDFTDIGDCYNELSSGYSSLFKEIEQAGRLAQEAEYGVFDDEDQREAARKKMLQSIQSILFDEDYVEFVEFLIPDGREDDFRREYGSSDIQDAELCAQVAGNLHRQLAENLSQLQSLCLVLVSRSVMKARIECKEVLCSLSAVASVLLSKQEGTSLAAEIEIFKSDDYYGLKEQIR
ncbi:hypothetical protein ACUN9Y_02490 [Halomonas sp. V046]|uniref:hypothetical protein n=1 Tax=Halomonas sp. V046 TaxID=3459611 RepID=UPI004043BA3A